MNFNKEQMRELIEWLLEGDISSYEIEKETGISRDAIAKIRRGDIKLGNVTLDRAEVLAEYASEKKNEAEFIISIVGEKWKNVDSDTKKTLLKNASYIDGSTGKEVSDGECIVDFNEYLSISGKVTEDGIVIEDEEIVYTPGDLPLWWR
jgi:hypothetical protein